MLLDFANSPHPVPFAKLFANQRVNHLQSLRIEARLGRLSFECGAYAVMIAAMEPGCEGYDTVNNFRTSGSTASTSEPRFPRSYFGGRSDANAARTVFLAIPSRLEISMIGTRSERCKRRISAQFSTEIILQGSKEGSRFKRRHKVSIHTSLTVLD